MRITEYKWIKIVITKLNTNKDIIELKQKYRIEIDKDLL